MSENTRMFCPRCYDCKECCEAGIVCEHREGGTATVCPSCILKQAEITRLTQERDAAIRELGIIAQKQGRELGGQDVQMQIMKLTTAHARLKEALTKIATRASKPHQPGHVCDAQATAHSCRDLATAALTEETKG